MGKKKQYEMIFCVGDEEMEVAETSWSWPPRREGPQREKTRQFLTYYSGLIADIVRDTQWLFVKQDNSEFFPRDL